MKLREKLQGARNWAGWEGWLEMGGEVSQHPRKMRTGAGVGARSREVEFSSASKISSTEVRYF